MGGTCLGSCNSFLERFGGLKARIGGGYGLLLNSLNLEPPKHLLSTLPVQRAAPLLCREFTEPKEVCLAMTKPSSKHHLLTFVSQQLNPEERQSP